MANRFLIVSLPKDEIAAGAADWVQQILDEAEAYERLEEVSELLAAVRVSNGGEEYWSLIACHAHQS